MGRILRKIRGLFGLTVGGGVVGGVLGGLYAVATTFLGFLPIGFGSIAWTVGLWSFFGAVGAAGAGLLLATVDARRTLSDLSPARAALGGVVLGALAPFGVVFAATGGFYAFGVYQIAAMSGLLGAGLGAGFVSMAKSAEARELGEGPEIRTLPKG